MFNIAVLLCVSHRHGPVRAGTNAGSATRRPPINRFPARSLDQLLGPIALYPDPLIAQILPASTLPTQIVLADRYVSGGGDPNQIDQQPWDASVQALARYPDVLKWMDDNLDWTTEVGQAFLNQQQDVMDSIQRLRQSAYNIGNLQSTPQQQVVDDGGDIEIVPADPQVIYVPVYQPDQVYYQSGFGITFGVGFPIGAWLDCDFDWGNHHLIVWDRDHPRPADWWHEPPRQRNTGHATVWRPEIIRAQAWRIAATGAGAPNNQPVVAVGRPVAIRFSDSRDGHRPRRPGRSPTTRSTPVARTRAGAVSHHPPAAGIERRVHRHPEFAATRRAYSNRGRQSLQTVTHSTRQAPTARFPTAALRRRGGSSSAIPSQSIEPFNPMIPTQTLPPMKPVCRPWLRRMVSFAAGPEPGFPGVDAAGARAGSR